MKLKEAKIILMNEWDPLDVGDNPHLEDEYDAYIPRILKIVAEGTTVEAIADGLKNIEYELGLTLPPNRRMAIWLSIIWVISTKCNGRTWRFCRLWCSGKLLALKGSITD